MLISIIANETKQLSAALYIYMIEFVNASLYTLPYGYWSLVQLETQSELT